MCDVGQIEYVELGTYSFVRPHLLSRPSLALSLRRVPGASYFGTIGLGLLFPVNLFFLPQRFLYSRVGFFQDSNMFYQFHFLNRISLIHLFSASPYLHPLVAPPDQKEYRNEKKKKRKTQREKREKEFVGD